ncbi:MAG: N-6 DNA methylase [Eubacteriaceae bacterium]|nr:N-6 DNA methylase [Eubacteriaceae bacterium]
MIQKVKKLSEQIGIDDPCLPVKLVLLKLMHDRGCYFDIKASLNEILNCFTFDRIATLWAGRIISLYYEDPVYVPKASRQPILELLSDPTIDLKIETEMALGQIYEETIPIYEKKELGITYTPDEIREYMTSIIRSEIEPSDLLLDPCCGCGCFLLAFYHSLLNSYYSKNAEEPIIELHERILTENIYGIDTSPLAVALSKLSLALLFPTYIECPHIYAVDALTESSGILKECTFDWIVTNPPYIGHKNLAPEYKKELSELYPEVFYNKSDISYCFFSLGEKLLKPDGGLIYITSRYFTQSMYAQRLRSFLLEKFTFHSIVDFYGIRPFKTAEVDPLIIFLRKGRYSGNVFTAKKASEKSFDLLDPAKEGYSLIEIHQDEMTDESFSFSTNEEKLLVKSIEDQCPQSLGDLMNSYQGIITGFDRAFVVSGKSPEILEAIDECGVKWIKGKNLAEPIEHAGKWLLYIDDDSDPASMPVSLQRLSLYKQKLSSRREVKKGSRKWYALQWGRNKNLFEGPKILFPYKSASSRFVYDPDGYFFSADIYAIYPREGFEEINMQKLAMLLSSPIYDSYFKAFLKKLGNDMYEFYPNMVMKAKVPSVEQINALESIESVERLFSG